METRELTFERREPTGKGAARKLRDTSRIPAVFYGPGRESELLALNPKLVRPLVGHSYLIKLSADGDPLDGQLAMLREVQRDPVSRKLLHADLYEVQMGRELSLTVAVEMVGLAKGVDEDGGTMEVHLRELEVRCLPRNIPSSIEVDVSALGIGDSLHLGDLAMPEGVTAVGDEGLAVVAVIAPLVESAEGGEEAEAAGEAPAAEAAEAKEDES